MEKPDKRDKRALRGDPGTAPLTEVLMDLRISMKNLGAEMSGLKESMGKQRKDLIKELKTEQSLRKSDLKELMTEEHSLRNSELKEPKTEMTVLLETKLEAQLKPLMNEITRLREEKETKDQLLKELRNRVKDLAVAGEGR